MNYTNEILNDEELTQINAGVSKKIVRTKVSCIHCHKVIEVNLDYSSAKCPFCKKINTFAG
jgi:hypothetical protein